MQPIFGASVFKSCVLILPIVFAACTSDESSVSYDRPESYGTSLYNRQLKKGTASFDCNVYSENDHAVLEMNFDVPDYQSHMTAVYDVYAGSSADYYIDITMTGVFQEEAADACEGLKNSLEGIKTSCSKSRVTGKLDLSSVNEISKSLMLSRAVPNLKSQCDEFYDTYKEMMADFSGKWDYGHSEQGQPALSCDVNVANDTVYMNVAYSDKSLAMKTTLVDSVTFRTTEEYTGLDDATTVEICNSHQTDKDIYSYTVACNGPWYAYSHSTTVEGVTLTLEDVAVAMKKELCPGLLEGSYTLEDIWKY